MSFHFLEHTADIKIKCNAKTLPSLFEEGARAFSDYVAKGKKIRRATTKKFTLTGIDHEALLYQFLDYLIYLLDAEQFIASSVRVSIKGFTLQATLSGDEVRNYQGLDHVKAATYAEMYVKKIKTGWEAQFVLDV